MDRADHNSRYAVGAASYGRGCRCAGCRAANTAKCSTYQRSYRGRAYKQDWRLRRKEDVESA